MNLRLSLGTACLWLVVGCGESNTTAPSASASVSASASGSTAPVGITTPQCKTYLERQTACIEKAPEAEREARKKALSEIEATWKAQSQTPDGQKRLLTACTAALAELDKTGACQ